MIESAQIYQAFFEVQPVARRFKKAFKLVVSKDYLETKISISVSKMKANHITFQSLIHIVLYIYEALYFYENAITNGTRASILAASSFIFETRTGRTFVHSGTKKN